MTVRVTVRVTVAYAAPGVEAIVPVAVHDGATVADAVAASGLVARCALDPGAIAFAIHGQRAEAAVPLRDGDRVEITRALVADPKAVRHARAAARPLPQSRKPPRR
ncbi:MAG: RnfH family protein [Burkholderiales bacterium]